MEYVWQALAWIPEHLYGSDGVIERVYQHLLYTLLSVVIAAVIAIPLGIYIGHTGRMRFVATSVTGAMRALPTLGLVALFGLYLGAGLAAPIAAVSLLAIPPLLAGAYAGVESIEKQTITAARAQGMTAWQIVRGVEIPLALPLLWGGLRSAVLQVIATVTVAAYLPLGGLGRFIFDGLPVRNYPEMLAGSILVIVLALVCDGILVVAYALFQPQGVAVALANDSRKRRRNDRKVAVG
ncbi:ABC transporter permease [Lysinibacter sp. HNR]|uniref:ABC transporter permease n=1 Tax=Lysinibacter sp. HNR TaxID=3031408 RepID=UPI0024352797|nr:ABC transporter permease [Lysinibacter sp. HNR]WGD38336.1 ABC transporter permease [Lysinibacter sp. HNR]